tara:strand:- start:90767 stop:92431 length:1665 start_codon:yes stop_codon:yes gene_type:complete
LSETKDILKKYWGFDHFRSKQKNIISSILDKNDTLAILPTGGGKSICFQIPGILLNGVTIVISPLLALMNDQVNKLRAKNINASLLSSSMHYREIDIILDNCRFGKTKFLYISPERLKSKLFIERIKEVNVSIIVIDEAHCISQWGHDFRTSYQEIHQLKKHKPKVPTIALTASATRIVKEDIIKQLDLKNVNCFEDNLARKNIHYKVIETENKLNEINNFIKKNKDEYGIIYCQTRKSAELVTKYLKKNNLNASLYHGGINNDNRKTILDNWLKNKVQFIVATNAFGMGIDKPDVRFVIHYEIPFNIENYYQETGRAGRDGKESMAITYFNKNDIELMYLKLKKKYPHKNDIKSIYNSICNFLNISIGSGNQETYNFDIIKFKKLFKIPLTKIYHSLKILETNETIDFFENTINPTRLKIIVNNRDLHDFENNFHKLSKVINILTRSFPGIFNQYININESNLSQKININESELINQLKLLEQYNIIDVSYKSLLPKIKLLHDRVTEKYLNIKSNAYEERKKIEKEKLDAMINYINTKDCRLKIINDYFNSSS